MTLSALIFPIGDDHYAVAADTVREVVSEPRPTRLPPVPAVVLGAFNLRGEVVPMFDAGALLGVGPLVEGPFAIVVTTAMGPAGIVVAGLPRVVDLGEQLGPSDLRGTLGIYGIEGGVAVLVDVEALLLPYSNLDASAVTAAAEGRAAR